jgi:hypothetical protein
LSHPASICFTSTFSFSFSDIILSDVLISVFQMFGEMLHEIGKLYFFANSKSLSSCAGTAITTPVP